MHCPSEDHMNVVVRILQYLKSSLGRGVLFKENNLMCIDGYTDADWAENITDIKSHQGISHLWDTIWSLGGVRNKRWLHYLVQRPSLEA